MGKIWMSGFGVLATLALSATTSQAAVLFYGGDPSIFLQSGGVDYYNYTLNHKHTGWVDTVQVFENVTVPVGQQWTVTSLYAFIGAGNISALVPNAVWEIRTGMTAASMGTLVYDGTVAAGATTYTPGFNLSGGSWPGGTWTVPLGSPVVLNGGQTYWINVTPTTAQYNMVIGGSTNNANAIGTGHDHFAYVWIDGSTSQTSSRDHSLGVIGTVTAVPEAATLGVLTLGVGALLARRRTR